MRDDERSSRLRRRRVVPYDSSGGGDDARSEPWAVHIADAVHKALRRHARSSDGSGHVPRTRRALPNRVRLAADMAAYVERRAALARGQMGRLSVDVSRSREREETEEACDESESLCCICLECVHQRCTHKPAQALQCGHVFHRACIQQWLRHRRCCPVDRSELSGDDNDDSNDYRTAWMN
ncbi:hypothetical protein PybrP1_003945 [[Pythium] brassicae (nom. inval.)]|nr:hypothetical protein PybrP1_003945 [[Pythium] brassicae (nom. inval.)]